MKDIGNDFKEKREEIGISVSEAAEDLGVTVAQLENLEDGNANAFKDIYFLKDLVSKYAKYLNIDEEKVMDEYNDFIFDYTSRIPVKEIEEKTKEQEQTFIKEEMSSKKIDSPYTRKRKIKKKLNFIYLYIAIIMVSCVLILFLLKTLLMRG